jgi:riboflavin-specific deaminase-like protein
MSLDGHIDDASTERLLLSGNEDFDRVDEVRAGCDAILVGSGTVLADDPRLLVRSAERRKSRVSAGLSESPLRVVLAGRRVLDPAARIFTAGDTTAIVYAAGPDAAAHRDLLGATADVVSAGSPVRLDHVLSDLASRGVQRLMVEGGQYVHTRFLAAGLVDELHVVIAPFLIGDEDAPRFVGPAAFPCGPGAPMRLLEVRAIGDAILARYLTGSRAARGSGD